MITTPEEYREKLWLIQTNNPPRLAILPYAEKIYNIDFDTRLIDSPEFLSVQKDHSAENIYFSAPRYVDYMDLSTTTCIIQYKLIDGRVGIYHVPFYDITSQNEYGNERIIFPWLISGEATALSGPVEYSVRFYRVNEAGTKFLYNLNTLPTRSKVLYGLDIQNDDFDARYEIKPSTWETLAARISELQNQDIYWIEMK